MLTPAKGLVSVLLAVLSQVMSSLHVSVNHFYHINKHIKVPYYLCLMKTGYDAEPSHDGAGNNS